MSESQFIHARITGISAAVPQDEIRIEDELEFFDGSLKKAQRATKMIGMHRRRVAGDGVAASDLCHHAAENLLRGLAADRQAIDALILVSQSPDYSLPATACILQHRLGLSQQCAAFDVNQGCAGYVYGLWLACSLVESRACSRVLLLAGEGLARIMDTDNRVVAPIFGDCGTATMVEYSAQESPSWFSLGTDGSGAKALIIPAGKNRIPLPKTAAEYEPLCERIFDQNGTPWRMTDTYMDGGKIFEFTLGVVPQHIREFMEFSGTTPETVDYLVLHQANKQIIQAIAEKSGFPPEKAPWETFSKYGNSACASIPAAICDVLAAQLRSGTRRVVLSGYGVGLAWASALVDLNKIWCSGVLEYETPAGHPTTNDLIRYWHDKLSGNLPK